MQRAEPPRSIASGTRPANSGTPMQAFAAHQRAPYFAGVGVRELMLLIC